MAEKDRYVKLSPEQFRVWFENKPQEKISGALTVGPIAGTNDWSEWTKLGWPNDIYYLDLVTHDAVYGVGEWLPWYIDDGVS